MPEGRLRTADGQVDVRIHVLRRTAGTLLGEIGLTRPLDLCSTALFNSTRRPSLTIWRSATLRNGL